MVTETDSGIGTDLDTVEDTAEKLEWIHVYCRVCVERAAAFGLTKIPAMCRTDMAWRLCPECGTGPDD